MKSAMGQCLDMFTAKRFKSKKLEMYTMTNANDQEIFRQAKVILLNMGQFFQIQDDYLDCYGNPEITGEIGTDIEDGKCSWLAIKALQKLNTEQKKIMEDNYGIDNPFNVAVIKDLYQQLKLQNTFLLYEEESYDSIRTCIQNLSPEISQNTFFKLLEKIYKRIP